MKRIRVLVLVGAGYAREQGSWITRRLAQSGLKWLVKQEELYAEELDGRVVLARLNA